MSLPTLKEIVKDNYVQFDSYRKENFYYNIGINRRKISDGIFHIDMYQFTVPLEDVGDATLLKQDKAISFMRWIRKAIDSNEFIKL